jgi:hypothetical protein
MATAIHRPAPLLTDADLDERIVALEVELVALRRAKADRADGDFLLTILQITDDWFTASELCALAPLSPSLTSHLAGASAKSIGCRLKRIADAQDRSGAVPALRLRRCKPTTRATVWKIETYLPTGSGPATGG